MQRRPGSFPGNEAASGGLLSPKSAENLGLKLVNYILDDNSPSVKELETRLKNVKLNYVRNFRLFSNVRMDPFFYRHVFITKKKSIFLQFISMWGLTDES
jgi:hypothetical protein